MLEAVMATYSGDNVFILDEETPFAQGQRVMIAAIEPGHIGWRHSWSPRKRNRSP